MRISLATVSRRSSFLHSAPRPREQAVILCCPGWACIIFTGPARGRKKAGVAVPEALAGGVGLPVCPNLGFCRGRKYRWGGWVRETNFRSP